MLYMVFDRALMHRTSAAANHNPCLLTRVRKIQYRKYYYYASFFHVSLSTPARTLY